MRTEIAEQFFRIAWYGMLGLCFAPGLIGAVLGANEARIRPWSKNPYFWEYKGEPVLLIGGSDEDNLFNHPEIGNKGLEGHLDLLVSVGGNYVRNVMSSRDEGNLWPFAMDEATGLYDLERMNKGYWQRFEDFLTWTGERDIFVQIEVFDRFDYAQNNWKNNPFNPVNNVNYTLEETGLPEVIPGHPGQRQNPFFRSVPNLENNTALLPWQEAFVDEMLSHSLPHGHILYCISNETNESEEWGAYWARYIRNAGKKEGVEVHVTEMWDTWDVRNPMHDRTLNHPELYTFIDISQNNHNDGQAHWNNAQYVRDRIRGNPCPINNVKMYGGISHGGGLDEGLRRLWRNLMAGMASARFHRPGPVTNAGPMYGAGLGEAGRAYIRSARYFMKEMGWPYIEPDLSFVALAKDHSLAVHTEKSHVVYTRNNEGEARIYLDGRKVAEMTVGGDLSNWDSGMALGLAGELNGERSWRGIFHEVAIYDQALDAETIAAHFQDGMAGQGEGIQAYYRFDLKEGAVVPDISGKTPALHLQIANMDAADWSAEGLRVRDAVRIASEGPAERLSQAIQASNALTLEVWITPAEAIQSGPARIVTISADPSRRNITLGQSEDAYVVRLRSTATSDNGIPCLQTLAHSQASIAAMRSPERDWAAIFVSHGELLDIDTSPFKDGLKAQWFDPRTMAWSEAAPLDTGHYRPPSREDWILVLR